MPPTLSDNCWQVSRELFPSVDHCLVMMIHYDTGVIKCMACNVLIGYFEFGCGNRKATIINIGDEKGKLSLTSLCAVET